MRTTLAIFLSFVLGSPVPTAAGQITITSAESASVRKIYLSPSHTTRIHFTGPIDKVISGISKELLAVQWVDDYALLTPGSQPVNTNLIVDTKSGETFNFLILPAEDDAHTTLMVDVSTKPLPDSTPAPTTQTPTPAPTSGAGRTTTGRAPLSVNSKSSLIGGNGLPAVSMRELGNTPTVRSQNKTLPETTGNASLNTGSAPAVTPPKKTAVPPVKEGANQPVNDKRSFLGAQVSKETETSKAGTSGVVPTDPTQVLNGIQPVRLVGRPPDSTLPLYVTEYYRTGTVLFIRYALSNRTSKAVYATNPTVKALTDPHIEVAQNLDLLASSQLGRQYLSKLRVKNTVDIPIHDGNQGLLTSVRPGETKMGLVACEFPRGVPDGHFVVQLTFRVDSNSDPEPSAAFLL